MSTRTVLRPHPVIVNGDMSGDLVSDVTILQSLSGASYEISWSGSSPVGTVSVQVSDTYSLNPDGTEANAGIWTSVYMNVNGVASQTIAVSVNTGSIFADVTKTIAYAIRVIYTRVSGTGTMQATVSGKVA